MHNETKSYQLPIETMPALELSHHLEDLVVFKNFLEERGIQTTNTRIERYIEYLRQAVGDGLIDAATIFKNSTEGPFQHSTDWMLYVLREVHELMWILKGVKAQVPLGVDEKLRVIVGGSDFAALDADSRSRNTQFELRIASYFCQAGCEVDLSTETDVIALSDDEAFYLECKRVGSVNQLEKRLSEAKKQLSRRMPRKDGKRVTYGCVAVDVTKCAFVHNGLTFAVTNEHSRDVIQEKLIGIANVSQRLPLFRDCRNLASYWFQIHIPSLILQPPITVTRFSSYHIFRDGMNRKDRRATRAFCDIFESVSQGDKRETPPKPLTPRKTFTVSRQLSWPLWRLSRSTTKNISSHSSNLVWLLGELPRR
ncbi:hypothetical protein [Nitrosomonas sp.]|uniref:hypothetical protein n=1 Tax=Nitrosomonas sp. TaxID=42353 RepID=UPI002730A7CD|nr:hypothetical protein [Nitrosomonas sp.]MDP2224188.1 hypothetical protein [Nitrosomonas sp.]